MTTTAAAPAAAVPTAPPRAVGHPNLAIAFRAFRQLRLAAIVLGVTFGAVAASAAVTYVDSFPTEASRRAIAASLSGDAGFSVLFGQVGAIDTVGGYTAYKCFVFLSTIGAVWAALSVTRLLRGEEDSGRWQLVLAGRTSPARATSATLGGVAAAIGVVCVVTMVLTMVAGARPGVDFSVADAAMFGLSLVVAAASFAVVAALCSQLAQTRRLATALSIGAFAVAFVVRMIADSNASSHWLLWATPLGWVELMQPLTGNRLAPLVPAVVTIAGLGALSVVLASRRDGGHGVLATRDTTPVRPFGLATPLGLTARLTAGVLGGWAAGMAATSFVFGVVAKPAADALAGSSSVGTTLTRFGAGGTGATQYLAVAFVLIGAVLALVPASQISAARDEEAAGRLAHILATPTTRPAWLGGRLALAAAAIVAMGLLSGAATWAGATSQGADVSLGTTVVAGVNIVPAALLVLSIGAIAFALVPRIAPAATYLVVAWSLIIDLVGSLVTGLSWLTRLSLFHYVSRAPAQDPSWSSLALYTGAAVLLSTLAIVVFDHRDMTTG